MKSTGYGRVSGTPDIYREKRRKAALLGEADDYTPILH